MKLLLTLDGCFDTVEIDDDSLNVSCLNSKFGFCYITTDRRPGEKLINWGRSRNHDPEVASICDVDSRKVCSVDWAQDEAS